MADNPLDITSPEDGDTVGGAFPGKPFTLYVTGTDTAPGAHIRTAVLKLNGKETNAKMTSLKPPESWLLSFLIDKIDHANPYTVEVTDTLGNMQTSTFHISDKKHPAHGRGSKTYDSPLPDTSVPGSGFVVVFPNPGPGLSVYVFMSQPGAPYYFGIPIQQDPEVWFFQNVAAGSNYTITTVIWENPPIYTYTHGITVT